MCAEVNSVSPQDTSPDLEALISARVPQVQKDELERLARAADRTLGAEIRRAVRFYIENAEQAA